MVFFLIGAPYKGSAEAVWADIDKHVLKSGISVTAKGNKISVLYSPNLRLNSIDLN